MNLFLELILFYFQVFISVIFISSSGFLLRKVFLNKTHKFNNLEDSFYGFILIGTLALFFNFFFELNQLLNSLIFILVLLLSINSGLIKNINKKDFLIKSFFVCTIGFILIIFSTVNRPDAWLYHLPYTKIINDHKIIIGAANIHERFAHISIFQYIAGFFNNYFLLEKGILIPISLVTSFFFVYLYFEFRNISKIKNSITTSFIAFLLLVISLYSFNRYSEFGNDAQPHIYYTFFSFLLFKSFNQINIQDNLKELSLLSLFLFLMKPTFVLVALIPMLIFLFNRDKLNFIKSKFMIIFCLIFLSWIVKNFLVSGCFVYPVMQTCIDNILWFSKSLNENILINEAWSKGWPDLNNKSNISIDEYLNNFIWLNTWLVNHFIFVLEKVLPIILFIVINLIFFIYSKSLKKKKLEENHIYFCLFNLLFFLFWLFYFPVYRLGISQIYMLIISFSFVTFINNIKDQEILKYKKYFNIFLIILSVGVISKNLLRIEKNFDKTVFPDILKDKKLIKVINSKNQFTHYKTLNGECGYSYSPCTHYEKELNLKNIFGYKVFYEK
ncbi:LIC_10190 family membrane protein [Candidatus Pelagibacter sp.]|uniref:LIC_10190 family membrane protein n=1 Tax=Candidatus Pelagibacter sp. TaxID=2024849 RepID=UPI003F87E21A